uniref:Putative DNA-binding protein n=1 Tax=Hot spring virus BHS1 TaxID=2024351 RepID=A0A2U7PAI8_9VIRU|nr:putative DNA-binding protein [Hot spring virus BHS1]
MIEKQSDKSSVAEHEKSIKTAPEKRRRKSSAIEYEKRIETTRRLILSGMSDATIRQNMVDMWGIKHRTTYHYLAEARRRNQAYVQFNEAEMFAEHIAHRRDLRRRAQAAGDLRAELQAARDEAELFGLYAAKKIIIDDLRDKSDGELIREFEELVKSAATNAGGGHSGRTEATTDSRSSQSADAQGMADDSETGADRA